MRLILLPLTSFLFFTNLALADICDSPSNLVSNCGFETGTLTPWQVTGTQSSPAFQGVTYGVDSADAYTGEYGAYLGGFGSPVSLQQSVSTTPGTSYVISYELAQSPQTPSPYTNNFSARFSGETILSLVDAPQFGFIQHTATVLATGLTSTIIFSGQDDTGFYSLDDVSVVAATPEPAGLAYLGVSLAFLAAFQRARTLKRNVSRH